MTNTLAETPESKEQLQKSMLDYQRRMDFETLTNAADIARRIQRQQPGPRRRYCAQQLEKACGELLLALAQDQLEAPQQ